MKKAILIIIIIFNFLPASDDIIYKNSRTYGLNEFLIEIKRDFISKINYFIPEYININPEKSFFNFKLKYDSVEKKAAASLSLHLRLPSLKLETERKKNSKAKEPSFSLEYKIRPYVRMKKSGVKIFIRNSLIVKSDSFFNKTFLVRFDRYLDGYWNAEAGLSVNKNDYVFTINLRTNKEEKNNIFYSAGFYKEYLNSDRLVIPGYETQGDRQSKPFFHTHRVFITYRHTLFHSKRVYYEIKPYLLLSKNYGFKLKAEIETSFNYKF